MALNPSLLFSCHHSDPGSEEPRLASFVEGGEVCTETGETEGEKESFTLDGGGVAEGPVLGFPSARGLVTTTYDYGELQTPGAPFFFLRGLRPERPDQRPAPSLFISSYLQGTQIPDHYPPPPAR